MNVYCFDGILFTQVSWTRHSKNQIGCVVGQIFKLMQTYAIDLGWKGLSRSIAFFNKNTKKHPYYIEWQGKLFVFTFIQNWVKCANSKGTLNVLEMLCLRCSDVFKTFNNLITFHTYLWRGYTALVLCNSAPGDAGRALRYAVKPMVLYINSYSKNKHWKKSKSYRVFSFITNCHRIQKMNSTWYKSGYLKRFLAYDLIAPHRVQIFRSKVPLENQIVISEPDTT